MILQLDAFDYTTASAARLVGTVGLWEALPRITRGLPTARLLMVADTLHREDIMAGFHQVATAEKRLPHGVLAYRMAYEDFLNNTVQEVRYIRTYLALDPLLDENGTIGLLGAYGIQATALDHELPRPFSKATIEWNRVKTDSGSVAALLRSKAIQTGGVLHPQVLHNLLGQEFPVWAALHIYTYPNRETLDLLRQKAAVAQYNPGKTEESMHEAGVAAQGISVLRDAIGRGEALHTFQLYVYTDAPDNGKLRSRVETVRGALPLEMEQVYAPGALASQLFSGEQLKQKDGTPLTTTGVALLAGSALSYRRRTQTDGIMLGIDRNQAPVILDIFDDRNASYNTVVLGQTGAGKTFGLLLLMMRHLLMGTRLIIIDPQGNVDLEFLGEDVYQRSILGTEQTSINVLDVIHNEVGMQIEMAVSMLRMLEIHQDEPLARALLDEALMELYKPVFGEGAEAPTLIELKKWLIRRAGQEGINLEIQAMAERLNLALQVYVTGSRAALFGKQTTVNFALDKAVNVFDVSKLPQQGMGGNLRSALLSVLVANINQGIRSRRAAGDRAPILFFVDEIGVLMRDPVIAEYISSEYKTSRARLVGMIVADQDLHSLLGPKDEKGLHHGIPILANAANTLIFNQKDGERERVREHFPSLPDSLIGALSVLPRGACIASFPDDLLVVNILPSQFELIVFSSRLQDKQRAKEIIKQLQKEISGELNNE
jgi:hypothetical protein